jgi:hypothetical protein
MNISFDKAKLDLALDGIHADFKDKIIDLYIELKKRYLKSFFSDEYDAVGISCGKFCETIFRFLEKEITGNFTPFGKHIINFQAELNKLGQSASNSANESVRVIIPRALLLLYTLRNKRGIGHVGGDIEANAIDISTIVKISDWVICELIRIYHNLSLSEAQLIVDSLNIKLIPVIWNVDGKRRVIQTGLSFSQKVLILLYNELNNKASLKELFEWSEYSSLSMFKSKILIPLHKEKLIEYNSQKATIMISPRGLNQAEEILLSITNS